HEFEVLLRTEYVIEADLIAHGHEIELQHRGVVGRQCAPQKQVQVGVTETAHARDWPGEAGVIVRAQGNGDVASGKQQALPQPNVARGAVKAADLDMGRSCGHAVEGDVADGDAAAEQYVLHQVLHRYGT